MSLGLLIVYMRSDEDIIIIDKAMAIVQQLYMME